MSVIHVQWLLHFIVTDHKSWFSFSIDEFPVIYERRFQIELVSIKARAWKKEPELVSIKARACKKSHQINILFIQHFQLQHGFLDQNVKQCSPIVLLLQTTTYSKWQKTNVISYIQFKKRIQVRIYLFIQVRIHLFRYAFIY